MWTVIKLVSICVVIVASISLGVMFGRMTCRTQRSHQPRSPPCARRPASPPASPPASQHVLSQSPSRIAIDPNAGYSAPGTYPQVGYLKSNSQGINNSVLPVYGRSCTSRVGRAYYYTIVPGSGIKVPLNSYGRDCMEEVGCEELYTGDIVMVPDVEQGVQWNVVIYKYNRD